MMNDEWTADQIEEAIPGAIREANWPVLEGLLLMLAARDPLRADRMHRAMQAALELRQQTDQPPAS